MLELASVWPRFGLDLVTCPHAGGVASFIVVLIVDLDRCTSLLLLLLLSFVSVCSSLNAFIFAFCFCLT